MLTGLGLWNIFFLTIKLNNTNLVYSLVLKKAPAPVYPLGAQRTNRGIIYQNPWNKYAQLDVHLVFRNISCIMYSTVHNEDSLTCCLVFLLTLESHNQFSKPGKITHFSSFGFEMRVGRETFPFWKQRDSTSADIFAVFVRHSVWGAGEQPTAQNKESQKECHKWISKKFNSSLQPHGYNAPNILVIRLGVVEQDRQGLSVLHINILSLFRAVKRAIRTNHLPNSREVLIQKLYPST